ncbi:dTDP-4-dehydrorhamnose reductase [Catenulispora rubra]|uniref:dTDP-4-dehydrorhamnose reductase n=1 Tax=Catenulispora rubra TaxID=280293 RepID=UPI001892733D|nr:dTDP-4-dehydrorhamnose reductase [Catenulispora rubra]
MSRPVVIVPGRQAPRRWLVTGAAGMLGADLVALLRADPAATVTALTRAELDVTDAAAVAAAVDGHDVVVNTAAWTDVDGAETHEAEATAVNGGAVSTLATACAATGARFLTVSTDYVFDGKGEEPYDEYAATDPINAYGRSKLVGEQAVLAVLPETGYIVRTAWLYGAHGANFVRTMLRLAGERETLDVVDDQVGQPTWTGALAGQLIALGQADRAPAGIYHGTASGQTSWFSLARAAFEEAGLDPERVRPTTSDKFVRPAERPKYSVLGHDRWAEAGLPPLGDWREMLASSGVAAPSRAV